MSKRDVIFRNRFPGHLFGQRLNYDLYRSLRKEFGRDKVTPRIYQSGECDGDFYVYFRTELPEAIVSVYAFPPEEGMSTRRHIIIDVETLDGQNSDSWEFTDHYPSIPEVIGSINERLVMLGSVKAVA